ncbi:MAG: hypothetical protein MJ147_08065 [Clostridia bacterium]|nr:hypothetical protein [Clostridia bacterium]
MKKIISVLLALIMVCYLAVPAFAGIDIYAVRSQIPIVVVSGDGGKIVDKDGNQLSKFSKFFTNTGEEGSKFDAKEILESIAKMTWPYFYNGVLTGDYEPYYDAVQTEVGKYFGDMVLDENGEASNGSGIEPWAQDQMYYSTHWDRRGDKGYYETDDYHFWYDWRLDPIEIADQLHDFIESISNVTGAGEVSILCRCLGTNVVAAYLNKYGTEHIHGVGFDGAVCMGAEPLSEGISGKFMIDGDGIGRILQDGNNIGLFNIDPLVIATYDLVEKSGLIDEVSHLTFDVVYKHVVQGVASALTLAAVSYPGYWACVKPADFDRGINYIFGAEGSAKRVKYAGLIEKITTYNETVKKHIPEILTKTKNSGVNVGVIAKYGLQLLPICESDNMIADSFVSAESSSFGATTGTIYKPLSESYIASQEAKGLGKYISPDKQIDASTCLFPDSTWFVKGVKHSEWTDAENKLLTTVITADRQLTVDDFDETQFMVRNPDDGNRMIPMTEENCNTENWVADEKTDHPKTIFGKLRVFFKALIEWFKLVIEKIKTK